MLGILSLACILLFIVIAGNLNGKTVKGKVLHTERLMVVVVKWYVVILGILYIWKWALKLLA